MNKLDKKIRSQILHMLCEGNSLRAVARMTGCSKNTVSNLLIAAGKVCAEYQDHVLRNLNSKRIQVDEIWSFVYAKKKNVESAKFAPDEAWDCWTWTAIDADSKLVMSWLVGGRDAGYAHAFMLDLESRIVNRVQLTSVGHKSYWEAVEDVFGPKIDYAQLVKMYGPSPESAKGRYSPSECNGTKKTRITGNPEDTHISTAYVERQNLTMRMHMLRFARLTNGFSRKIENHMHSVALHFMYYNFVLIHSTLRVTPAMEAGVTDRLWEVSDIVSLIEKRESEISK